MSVMKLAEYDRLVIGYHGTRRETALRIVSRESSFRPSRNEDDWLGHGIYFWEHAPQQAWKWAAKRYATNARIAVLGALVRLGNCLDLLEPANGEILTGLHRDLLAEYKHAGKSPRQNANHRKYLDCETFEYAYEALEQGGLRVDSSRAVYVPTGGDARIWQRSWISRDAHIQLCVRNPSCILGVWLVPEQSE